MAVGTRGPHTANTLLGAAVALLVVLAAHVTAAAAGAGMRGSVPMSLTEEEAGPAGPEAPLRPIVFMHGLTGNRTNTQYIEQWMAELRPGQRILSIPLFEDKESFQDLFKQLEGLKAFVKEQGLDTLPGGYTLLCHSQGALLCRVLIEELDRHNVHTFVSLAGPQMGVYGEISIGHLHPFFPKVTTAAAHLLFYTQAVAKRCSFCEYWHDPLHAQAYLEKNRFLPVFNCEAQPADSPDCSRRRENFLKVKRQVYFASPADETIVPWQSGHFGFFGASGKEVVGMRDQRVYTDDTFGLRTLDLAGGLVLAQVENVGHKDWLLSRSVFENNVLQYL